MSTRLRVGGVHLVHDVIYDDKIIRCYHRLASLKPADHVKADAHCAGQEDCECVVHVTTTTSRAPRGTVHVQRNGLSLKNAHMRISKQLHLA